MLPVVVVAGGPSVTLADIRLIGMARAADKCRVIAVNDAVYPCWFADQLHAADRRWWNANDGVPLFYGSKTSMEETEYHDVLTLKNTGLTGYDPRPMCVRTGSNSGYQAVHIAAQSGAERILILGIDFTENGAREHWFGRHKQGMDFGHSNIKEWREAFRILTDELNALGIAVLNAGRQSSIDWIPHVEVKDFFR